MSLVRALRLVKSVPEVDAMDLGQTVDRWPHIDDLLSLLTTKYADLLEVTVEGEDDDFLLWHGVRVVDSFADPTIEPDAEHLCIVILALEGLLPEIMSANWDGLIEKAASQLSGGGNLLSVRVLPADVRQAGFRVQLYKFHGCAVLAGRDEATYRPYLIARKSQIDDWDKDHSVFQQQLLNIVTSKATLMIGLSAQDSNIRSVFGKARDHLNWPWPGTFPAIAFSQTELGADQIVLLKSVYKNIWAPGNRAQIQAESIIPTYAKQGLLALVLRVLSGKLSLLLRGAEGLLPDAERDQLVRGLIVLRNMLADADDGSANHYDFMRSLIQHLSRLMGLFRDGRAPVDALLYRPLTMSPASHIPLDPGVQASGLQELAVAVATLGLGADQGLWTLHPATLRIQSVGPLRSGRRYGRFPSSLRRAPNLLCNFLQVDDSQPGVMLSLCIARPWLNPRHARRDPLGEPELFLRDP